MGFFSNVVCDDIDSAIVVEGFNVPDSSKTFTLTPKVGGELVDRTEVENRLSIKRSMIYLKLNPKSKYFDPSFPRQIKTGKRQVRWLKSDIDLYIKAMIERGDA